MYSLTYRPGQLRGGSTCVKLSKVRDPCRFQPEKDGTPERDEDANPFDCGDGSKSDAEKSEREHDGEEGEEDDDNEECAWEQEDEYTLANSWPHGADLERGIIYVCIRSPSSSTIFANVGW